MLDPRRGRVRCGRATTCGAAGRWGDGGSFVAGAGAGDGRGGRVQWVRTVSGAAALAVEIKVGGAALVGAFIRCALFRTPRRAVGHCCGLLSRAAAVTPFSWSI